MSANAGETSETNKTSASKTSASLMAYDLAVAGEARAIAHAEATTSAPNTRDSLTAELRALGVAPGMTLLVHSSQSALGWVCGGPVAIVQALLDALTPEGTLVVPTHSGDYSDPANWQHPPVPAAWVPLIRAMMPAFEPQITPTRQMGAIAETARAWPGAQRSRHPNVSFTAIGPNANTVTANHSYDDGLGEKSPLARLYELDGWVLLLGIGYGNNTSFHLAEYRAPGAVRTMGGAPILDEQGQRIWHVYQDIELDDEPFPQIGADYERRANSADLQVGNVGAAQARLFRQRPAVDFAQQWIAQARQG
ncbi:MAG: AAC(3) family N-acetyltransferase [Ktedonobacterales bacterium]